MEPRTIRFPWVRMVAVAVLAASAVGCAKTEQKLGRGIGNSLEIVRLGEMRRSIEQSTLFGGSGKTYTGMVRGFNKTIARTGVGIYEIVTCPFPPYDPVFTHYLSPAPAQPDCFTPGLVADSTLSPDTNLGFSGGEVFPMMPGSRFRVFEN